MSLIYFRGQQILPPLINESSNTCVKGITSSNKLPKEKEICDFTYWQKQGCVVNEFLRQEEETKLLSLPSCAALSVILPGLKLTRCEVCKNKPPDNANVIISLVKDNGNISKTVIESSKCDIVKSLPSTSPVKNNNEMNHFDLIKEKDSSLSKVDELSVSEGCDGTTSLSFSYASSQVSDSDIQTDGDLDLEFENSKVEFPLVSSPKSGCSDGASIQKTSSIGSNGKIGPLKARSDSNDYLEDYLQLLTSRSDFSPVPPLIEPETEGDPSNLPAQERRCSVPLIHTKSKGTQKCLQRNLSVSSDKSLSRSVGSNYLDSYLGNLTDSSWVVYPTESKSQSTITKAVTFDLKQQEETKKKTLSSIYDCSPTYLHRKLRFIDPEKFFYKSCDKSNLTVGSSHSPSPSLASNHSVDEEGELNKNNTIDNATSPDISSSIFDKDDVCNSSYSNKTNDNNSSPTSDLPVFNETQEFLDSEKSNESSSGITSMSVTFENNSSCTKEISSDDKHSNMSSSGISSLPILAPENLKGNINTKETTSSVSMLSECSNSTDVNSNVPMPKYIKLHLAPKVMTSFHIGGKIRVENKIEEESSSSSDLSSATEPSTIVLAGDQVSINASDFDLTSLSSDVVKSRVTSEEEYLKSLDDILNTESKLQSERRPSAERNSSTSDNVTEDSLVGSYIKANPNDAKLSFMIEMLKAKQLKEINDLTKKHENEMQNFVNQLQQLSEAQVVMLTDAYNSPNNNSLNEILDFNISMQTSLTKSMTDSTGTSSSLPSDSIVSSHCETHTASTNQSNNQGSESSPNATPTTPSFFLHTDTGNKNEPENVKISQIFSSARSRPVNVVAQSITELLNQHPELLVKPSQAVPDSGSLFVSSPDSSPKVSSNSMNDSAANASVLTDIKENGRPVDTISKMSLEAGLDLVPARESDLATLYNKVLQPNHYNGICKLQAFVRGRRIRKVLNTSDIRHLITTLKEVEKLTREFHQDILSDNIKKGDVRFHRALFNQEQQTREKLHKLLIETSPGEQLKMIRKDRLTHESRTGGRKRIIQTKFSSAHRTTLAARSVSSKTKPIIVPTSHFNSKPTCLSSPSQHGRIMKRVTARMLSEPSRLCRSKNVNSSPRKPSLSPRDRCSSIPAASKETQKTKETTLKLKTTFVKNHHQESRSQTNNNANRIPNAHLCKTQLATNKNSSSKLNGVGRPVARGGEPYHGSKTWR